MDMSGLGEKERRLRAGGLEVGVAEGRRSFWKSSRQPPSGSCWSPRPLPADAA